MRATLTALPTTRNGTPRRAHTAAWLAARVFPALEEQLAHYYTTLERVDLRIGIETRGLADDHAKQHLVLKVCLADVRRCRPFLIVLVGDRYGWVPPIDRARAAARAPNPTFGITAKRSASSQEGRESRSRGSPRAAALTASKPGWQTPRRNSFGTAKTAGVLARRPARQRPG